jgi:Mg-chelatase subunit ChlD
LLIVLPLFLVFYQKPTCFDNRRDGDELGIDCGGSCAILCSFEVLDPIVHWARIFPVSGDIYSAVAYVENPNISSSATDVPYVFKIYDDKNQLITERTGTTFIPRNQKFAVFEGQIQITGRTPKTVQFEFTQKPVWKKTDAAEPDIQVTSKALMQADVSPRIEAELENKSLDDVSNIEVSAIVYDGNNNAVAASRTYINSLPKGSSAQAVFTWPEPFEAKLDVCQIPSNIMLVLDRSGSMASDGANPPEPLTDAKNAAVSFIDQLKDTDQVGMESFATTPSDPIDVPLSSNHAAAKEGVSALSIHTDGSQNTDLGDGLLRAMNEIGAKNQNADAKNVIIALTDGLATEPEKEGDKNYPEEYAADAASQIRSKNIQLYTIGLGSDVNASFLQSIATDNSHYYAAPTSKQLQSIYNDIATKICEKRPAIIEVITRILPDGITY